MFNILEIADMHTGKEEMMQKGHPLETPPSVPRQRLERKLKRSELSIDSCRLWKAAYGPGCVKTFWSRFYSQEWNENGAPTRISGLLINQTLADFT